MLLATIVIVTAAGAYLAGEQTTYRSLGYGSERAFASLAPWRMARAWLGR